jgi:hypothetical protein
LGSEELHDLYSSPNIIGMVKSRRMRLVLHVARISEKKDAYRVLVVKPEGKRPLGRRRCRLEDNIKLDIREIEWGGMNWIRPAQDREQSRVLVNMVTNPRVQ